MQTIHQRNLETIRKAMETHDARHRAQSFGLTPRRSRWQTVTLAIRRLLPW